MLGVIRPTVEAVCHLTLSRHIGVLATAGTINSESYTLEIKKTAPDITVTGQACPMWVPLVENDEFDSPGADYFVKKRIDGILRLDPAIDTLVLGCTHYPLLMNKIVKYTPPGVPPLWATTLSGIPIWPNDAPKAGNATISPQKTLKSSTTTPPFSCTNPWKWNK